MQTMNIAPWIHYDFQALDCDGRAILDGELARADIAKQSQQMSDGRVVVMYDIDTETDGTRSLLIANGVLEFDKKGNRWVARYDRGSVRREYDMTVWPALLGAWEDRT